MDFKTTFLKNNVEVKEDFLPEIPGLHFGLLYGERAVFDYTAYLEENELPAIDYKVFMRLNKHFIEKLASGTEQGTAGLFYQNTDGHILIASELVFLCLAFLNPELLKYFTALLSDVISDGVAYSNGYIYSLAAQRLPSDVMSDLIKERQSDDSGSEQ